MTFIEMGETPQGVMIYGRIDEDGKCRFTCTADNPEYQAWLNPAEHFTPSLTDEATTK